MAEGLKHRIMSGRTFPNAVFGDPPLLAAAAALDLLREILATLPAADMRFGGA